MIYFVLKLFKVPIDLYLSMLTIYKPDIEYVDIVDTRMLFAKVLMLIKKLSNRPHALLERRIIFRIQFEVHYIPWKSVFHRLC